MTCSTSPAWCWGCSGQRQGLSLHSSGVGHCPPTQGTALRHDPGAKGAPGLVAGSEGGFKCPYLSLLHTPNPFCLWNNKQEKETPTHRRCPGAGGGAGRAVGSVSLSAPVSLSASRPALPGAARSGGSRLLPGGRQNLGPSRHALRCFGSARSPGSLPPRAGRANPGAKLLPAELRGSAAGPGRAGALLRAAAAVPVPARRRLAPLLRPSAGGSQPPGQGPRREARPDEVAEARKHRAGSGRDAGAEPAASRRGSGRGAAPAESLVPGAQGGAPRPAETPSPTGSRGCWDTTAPHPRSGDRTATCALCPARPRPGGSHTTPADRESAPPPRPGRPVSARSAAGGRAEPRF